VKVSSSTETFRPGAFEGFFSGWLRIRQSREIAKWALSLLEIQPADRILEIGAGSGTAIELAARHCPLGLVTGIEADPFLVRRARRRNKLDIRHGRIVIGNGSVSALPYADSSFHKVYAINSVQHWPHLLRDLKEIHRVLRPDGKLVIVRHLSRGKRQSAAKVKVNDDFQERLPQQIAMAGFDVVYKEIRLMTPASAYGIVGSKIVVEN